MFLPAVGCEEAAGLRPHSFQNQVLLWVMLNTCRVPDTTLSTSKYLHKVEFLIPSREAEPLGCVCVCFYVCVLYRGLPGGTAGKESACQCRRHKRCQLDPWVRKITLIRKITFVHIKLK